MRQVGRELQGEQRVVELQHLAHIGTDRCIARQFEQAAVVFRQLEFACRAQHAETLDAAQLAHADLEGLAVLAGRQFGTDQGEGHPNARTRIRRAANNLQGPVG